MAPRTRNTGLFAVLAMALAAAPPPTEEDGYRVEWTGASWEGAVHLPGDRMGWEASLSGLLYGPADRQAVAFVVEMEEVLDARGRSLLPTAFDKRWSEERRQRRRDEQVRRVFGRRGEDGVLGSFNVPLGAGEGPVSRIAKATGSVYVMEVTESRTVDIPLNAETAQWHEAGEGVRFRVQGVETRGNQLLINITHTLGEEGAGEDLVNPPYLFSVTTLNEAGEPEATQPPGFSNRGEGQLVVNVFSSANPPAKPAGLRLVLATTVEERRIEFTLTDIDLGLGAQKEEAE